MTFNFDVNNLARTVALAAVALPLTLSSTNLMNVVSESVSSTVATSQEVSKADQDIKNLRDASTRACLDYYLSKGDSKLEREAKNTLEEVFGGAIDHRAACNYLMR